MLVDTAFLGSWNKSGVDKNQRVNKNYVDTNQSQNCEQKHKQNILLLNNSPKGKIMRKTFNLVKASMTTRLSVPLRASISHLWLSFIILHRQRQNLNNNAVPPLSKHGFTTTTNRSNISRNAMQPSYPRPSGKKKTADCPRKSHGKLQSKPLPTRAGLDPAICV